MATIREEIDIDQAPETVWAALRDFDGAERLFAGVATGSTRTGARRTVTFADGSDVHEHLVASDDGLRRLAYAAVDNPAVTHHSSALEVRDAGNGTATVIWTTDVLPDGLAGIVARRMRAGAAALQRSLSDLRAPAAAAGLDAPIARVWRGWTTTANADAYQHIVSTDVLPSIAARALPGYDGAFLLRRELDDEVEFATIMLFQSRQAVVSFAGPDEGAAHVPPQARAVLSRFDERSAHFTVLMTPRRPHPPARR